MAHEIFNRYEFKYLLNTEQSAEMFAFLQSSLSLDKHNIDGTSYPIYTLTLDTFDRQLIRNSLDKPLYKQKVRLRSYREFDNANSKVFLEIKKKYDGVTNKRRSKMTLGEAQAFIETAELPGRKSYHNFQVLKELQYIFQNMQLRPTAQISYNRIAMFDLNSDLRVTFDSNIVAKSVQTDQQYQLIPDGCKILEIKSRISMPITLSQYLANNQIKRISFSKYGKYHIEELKRKENYV